MGKIFEKVCYASSPIHSRQERYVTVEVYDHRKNNPLIEFFVDDLDIEIQMDLRDLLAILDRCDLSGFVPKPD